MYPPRRPLFLYDPSESKVLLALFLCGVLLLFGIMVLILRLWRGDVAPVGEADRELSSTDTELSVGGARIPLAVAERTVLDNYFAALGGSALLESINSLRAEGTLTFPDGRRHPVVIIKKAGRIRVSVRLGTNTLVQAMHPNDAWLAVFHGGKVASVGDLDESGAKSLGLYTHVASELYLARRENWPITYLGVRDFNYRMLHVFEVEVSQRHHARFFIDPENFLEVGREDLVFEDDGTLKIFRILNSGILEASGLRLPRRLDTYVDGKLTQTLVLNQIEINPGILDSIFNRPTLDLEG